MVLNRITLLVLVALLVLPVLAAADTHVIANSADWRDVYSTLMYANLQGYDNNFLVNTRHSTILLYSIPTDKDIIIVSSRSNPFVVGYDDIIRNRGYASVEELVLNDVNLDLAEELPDIKNFIIMDDAYGYNAIAAAPYAVVSKSYVLFANSRNIDDIDNFLQDRDPDNVLIFGQVDPQVKTALDKYSPEIIDEGDRFDNNIAIVKKYQAIKHAKQTLMSNGEFIEKGIMSGADPVLFIGKSNVPDQIRDYIQNSEIEVAVLVGNELIGTATFIRREIGVSVFVKFAQGARVPSGTISAVEDLDRFPIPTYTLDMSIFSAVYNRATEALEVTYKNNVNLATYFKSTITVINGANTYTLGDPEAVFLDKNGYKTILYTETSAGDPLRLDEDTGAQVNFFTLFGEGPKSLENTLEATLDLDFVTILDDTNLEITSAQYDTRNDQFIITVQNTGDLDVYTQIELVDVYVNDEYVTFAGSYAEDDGTMLAIGPGKSAKVRVDATLTDEDIYNNKEIQIKAYYGARPNALTKLAEASMAFTTKGIDIVYYILIGVLVILLLLLPFLGKRCKHCKERNRLWSRTCRKCGAPFGSRSHGHPGRKT